MITPTLLGHLATFNSLFSQGELLCTHGLVYLLRTYEAAGRALTDELKKRTGASIEAGLVWHAETVQSDKARPDIEGRTAAGTVAVKIEAKLDADCFPEQLKSYRDDLVRKGHRGALIALVPFSRCKWMAGLAAQALSLVGPGPSWPVSDECSFGVAVLSWEDLFAVLRASEPGRYAAELEQLEALYSVLSASYIAPVTSDEELRNWSKDRKTDFRKIVDRVTDRLSGDDRLLPLQDEPIQQPSEENPHYYVRRYVRWPKSVGKSYFSIGVRAPPRSCRWRMAPGRVAVATSPVP